ncbi:MAG: hypothetical protein EGP79_04825 [Roseburia intestinalis]|nr:hypothetical protein [Roseburia intestinalis]
MKNYERPQIFCQEDLCEGVYLASGDEVCKSIYIHETWHKPNHGAYQGTNLDEYYGAAEPPVRCGESHLSGLTEPLRSL